MNKKLVFIGSVANFLQYVGIFLYIGIILSGGTFGYMLFIQSSPEDVWKSIIFGAIWFLYVTLIFALAFYVLSLLRTLIQRVQAGDIFSSYTRELLDTTVIIITLLCIFTFSFSSLLCIILFWVSKEMFYEWMEQKQKREELEADNSLII